MTVSPISEGGTGICLNTNGSKNTVEQKEKLLKVEKVDLVATPAISSQKESRPKLFSEGPFSVVFKESRPPDLKPLFCCSIFTAADPQVKNPLFDPQIYSVVSPDRPPVPTEPSKVFP